MIPNIFSLEKAVLVGVELATDNHVPSQESLAELAQLATTAGAKIVGQLTQNRQRPDQKYFIGTGKLAELKALTTQLDANLVIFDVDLSSAQERNLENELSIKVIDRTELILDIFAQHARSREGRLQVELAQSSFILTRLTGHGSVMSRLGGGIGTRGPGETKLEYDRRKVRDRISRLKKELEQVRQERALRREKRKTNQLPQAALVGYTNSGKSTLLNKLTGADVLCQDQLFATLDPTIRRLTLSERKTILLTDTVGFIQKLPHQLIAAFRATLEEVSEADVLLHVVDISSPYFEDQIKAVYATLAELNCADKPTLTIFNKTDQVRGKIPGKFFEKYSPAIAISALREKGLAELKAELARFFDQLPGQ